MDSNIFDNTAIRIGVHEALRIHVNGTDEDLSSIKGMLFLDPEQSLPSADEQARQVTLARVAGNIATHYYDIETGGFTKRTLSRMEISLARIFDPTTREAVRSGIPQESARALAADPLRHIA